MPQLNLRDDTSLYYEDHGTGRPLVFIHGWPLSGAMWEYQIVPLTRAGFRCVTFDRRGFGRSGKPYSGFDYDSLGQDLSELIEHLNLKDVTLIGFSMGGGEVMEYLTKHNQKERVTKAILVSSIVPYLLKSESNSAGVDAAVFEKMRKGIETDRPAFLTDFTEKFFGVGLLSSPVSNSMLAASCEVAMTASPIATLACLESFSTADYRAACSKITVSTLIIHGDQDQTVPIEPTSKAAAELMDAAELEIYAGAPHGLFYTHREDLNRDIAAFASEGTVNLTTRK